MRWKAYSVKRNFGFLFFAFGILLILNSFHGLTGFVITEKIKEVQGSVFGLMFILGGMFLILMAGLDEKLKIIETKRFQKAIKGQPLWSIQNAISKIGTGLAGEENLRYLKRKKSIRTSKRGRILYEIKDGTVILKEYTPDHRYKKA